VISRCRQLDVDEVVCAIPQDMGDNLLAHHVGLSGVRCIRGARDDVLARYHAAAQETRAGAIVRITADCPLISVELCNHVIAEFKRTSVDYASNVGEPRTFPKGTDCEVFKQRALALAHRHAKGDDREHVTPWMRRNEKLKKLTVKGQWPIEGRITLDTEDDYKVICAHFGHEPYRVAA
jgi:spore coat polysaccharide biosynthesis protein SpsF (cytidylyltransferase family)